MSTNDELFDVLNEDGTKTGRIKSRGEIHRDGDWHGSVHVWVYRKTNGKILLLLQKRSKDKDSFPGCYDAGCTGHVDAGENFVQAAVREVHEELGLETSGEELIFLFQKRQTHKAIYSGKPFISNEINSVYVFEREIDGLPIFQKSEIEEVKWQSADLIIKELEAENSDYCLQYNETVRVINYLKNSG
ncbi:MAG: NUDIX domain-containing protein [Oscillospiraceae bacterium]|jgi:8-oxo-dGTP diphosphatase